MITLGQQAMKHSGFTSSPHSATLLVPGAAVNISCS